MIKGLIKSVLPNANLILIGIALSTVVAVGTGIYVKGRSDAANKAALEKSESTIKLLKLEIETQAARIEAFKKANERHLERALRDTELVKKLKEEKEQIVESIESDKGSNDCCIGPNATKRLRDFFGRTDVNEKEQ